MKIKVLVAALMMVIVGFGSCGSKKESSEKSIKQFKVNGMDYIINGNNITYLYTKTAVDTWVGEPVWPIAPDITISDKATITPSPDVKQNFVQGSVTYTVTAEDGSTKTYTVKAERGVLP